MNIEHPDLFSENQIKEPWDIFPENCWIFNRKSWKRVGLEDGMGGVGRMGGGWGGAHTQKADYRAAARHWLRKQRWMDYDPALFWPEMQKCIFGRKYIPHSSTEGNQSKFDQVGGLPGLFISLFRSKSIEPDPVILIVSQPHRIPNCNQPNRL